MLATGALLDGRYRIDELVGRGGMANVFRAVDTETGTPVAVKLLRSSEPRDAVRFRSEMRVLQQLDHPGITRLHDVGTDDDVPYLVLDLVDGSSLADRLADGPLGLDLTLDVGGQVAAALAHAHDVGVTHRDVKPSNIMLDASGHARLTDFGIARMADTTHVTAVGLVVGSPRYLAPEQVAGGPVGPAADVYSLALVVIECLTGTPCYGGGQMETAFARLHHPPTLPPGLPGWLGDLLTAMTAADPWARPTAGTVARAFRERVIDATLTAPLVVRSERNDREIGRVERALVLAALLLVSVFAWQSFGRRDPAASVRPAPAPTAPTTVTTLTSLPPVTPAPEPVVVEPPPDQAGAGEGLEADAGNEGDGGEGDDNSGPGNGNGKGKAKGDGEDD